MKKIIILCGLSVLFLILDNVLIPFISIKGFYPSLLFVFLICYSIINESWEGLWLGVFTGILQDIYFMGIFGTNSFANMIIGVIAGIIGKNIFKEKKIIPVVTSLFLSILKNIIVILILYIMNKHVGFKMIVFNSLYNMLVCIVMYSLVYKLCQKQYMQRRWKF